MKRITKNTICVLFSFMRLSIKKIILGKRLTFRAIERISPNVELEFSRLSNVVLGNKIRVHSGTKIKVRPNAFLEIKDGTKFNSNCIIACRSKIIIGEETEFGPSVYVYDHDHIHNYETGKNLGYNSSSIVIGKNCWIGANTIILKGTHIGDNSVVAAGSVLTGCYPSRSLIYQKRETSVKTIVEVCNDGKVY